MSTATEGLVVSSPSTDRTSVLLSLLEAHDIKTVHETKALIHESLHLSRDPGLLNALVEYYIKTRSQAGLQILSSIHESRAQALFEKMNECLKLVPSRVDTLTLLGHVVRKQPSWLYKIIKTPLFETLIKCMKGDTDILVLTSGILTITTLLPLVPASISPWLRDLFDIYTRLCAFRTYRQGNAPEVYHLHLHVAVYLFFHRLYAMYPNSLLVYLRTIYAEPSKQSLFKETIKPMLEHVRLHPCIITETSDSETEKHRWRKKEPHDIVIECMKVSLDPVDRIQEDGCFTTSSSRHSRQEMFAEKSISSVFTMSGEMTENPGPDLGRLKERRMSDSATQTGKSLQSGDSGTDSCSLPVICPEEIVPGWSLADLFGLSTPPSSQMSPSTSNPDLLSSLNLYSRCSTPGLVNTPGQSPTPSLAGDVAQLHGPSLLLSLAGSKGKNSAMGQVPSGRGTPVHDRKAASHDGQLTRALYSALVHESNDEVLSAPAALGGHQTSTPKGAGNSDSGIKFDSPQHQLSFDNSIPQTQTLSNDWNSFENRDADVGDDILRTSSEHCVRNHGTKVSPKEEFRDFEESKHCSSENEDVKSLKSHLSVGSVECSKESVTPVGCQSLDLASLPNTPIQYQEVSDSSLTSTNTKERDEVVLESYGDFGSSLPCGNHQGQLSSLASARDKEFPSATPSETSVATEDVSLDSAQMHHQNPESVPQQNHHELHSCDLLASLPELLPVLGSGQSETGCSPASNEGGALGLRHWSLSSQTSPTEILDNYLQVGSSVHHGALSRIPLVSQSGTDWTHFGGEPPANEVEILRGQVQLIHNQLLFERHKCDLHAVRNRRLIGKTFKAVQFQEELQATKDQLRLQEEKMRELTEALNKQVEDNRRLKEITLSWDHHQRTELRNLLNENKQLHYVKQELQNKLEAQQKDSDTQQMEVYQYKARVFTLKHEMEKLNDELSKKDQLTEQVNHLVKELLIMGELNQKQKDIIQKLSSTDGQNPESVMQLNSCYKELATAKQHMRKQKAELDALNAKLADMESALSTKDIEIRELKKFTEGLKDTYTGTIQSLEEKYRSQKRITQALESYILHLQSSVMAEWSTEFNKGDKHTMEQAGE